MIDKEKNGFELQTVYSYSIDQSRNLKDFVLKYRDNVCYSEKVDIDELKKLKHELNGIISNLRDTANILSDIIETN